MASETSPASSDFITVTELAELLHTSTLAVYKMRHRGNGPRAVRGHGSRRLLFPRDEVDRWLREHLEARGDQAEAVGT